MKYHIGLKNKNICECAYTRAHYMEVYGRVRQGEGGGGGEVVR